MDSPNELDIGFVFEPHGNILTNRGHIKVVWIIVISKSMFSRASMSSAAQRSQKYMDYPYGLVFRCAIFYPYGNILRNRGLVIVVRIIMISRFTLSRAR